jgi:hypothetical protein
MTRVDSEPDVVVWTEFRIGEPTMNILHASVSSFCRGFLLVSCFSLGLSSRVLADPVNVPGLLNTGVDDAGTPRSIGSTELHWSLSGPTGTSVFIIAPNPGWVVAPAGSAWIGPASGTVSHPLGLYVYSLSFDLTGIDISTLSISGRYTSDNNGEIFLNGVSKGFVNKSEPVSSAS